MFRSHVIAALALVLLATAAGATPFFMGLGNLPGESDETNPLPRVLFDGRATGVSADGSVVVGASNSASGDEAFRWTAEQGMIGLGDLSGGLFGSFAQAVSADGSIVVGNSANFEPFVWTQAGMVGLGGALVARNVSADGAVVVGQRKLFSVGNEAFRWTSSGGVEGLGDLPGGFVGATAEGVSADGSVIVGTGSSASGNEAFRWTESGGMVGLGDLPGGSFGSFAWDVSADGSTVVGTSHSHLGNELFLWTESGGMVGLGILPGFTVVSGAAMSGDGARIVGQVEYATTEVFLWDAAHGMRLLGDVLTAQGVDLSDWRLTAAVISDDGRWVAGTGFHISAGVDEPWLAFLPEPGSGWLLGLGLLGYLCASARKRRASSAANSCSVRRS
jgi:probable HAF family extracellular repeat protein